jgi:hypothetical protein
MIFDAQNNIIFIYLFSKATKFSPTRIYYFHWLVMYPECIFLLNINKMSTDLNTSNYPSKFALSFILFTSGSSTIFNIYALLSKDERDKLHWEKNLLIPSTIVSSLLVLVSVCGLVKPEIFSDKRVLWFILALLVSNFGIGVAANIHEKAGAIYYVFGVLSFILWIWIFGLNKGLKPSKQSKQSKQ